MTDTPRNLPDEVDLLIVGSGAGSICAALVARSLGKSALILEKQEWVGGSTALSGGVLWVPNNTLMKEEGIPDSYARAREYFDAAVTHEGPCTSSARREFFLKGGPPAIDFLRARGMEFFRPEGWSDYYDELPGGEPRSRCLMPLPYDARKLGEWAPRLARSPVGAGMPIQAHEIPELFLVRRTWAGKRMALRLGWRILESWLRRSDLVVNGSALQGRMLEIALREGIRIIPSCGVEGLVEAAGRVIGVRVATRGAAEGTVISARGGVLLNAGGFSRNAELRRRFGREPSTERWTTANAGDTGEILLEAMALGAATENLDAFWWVPTSQCVDGTWPEGAVLPDGSIAPFMHHIDMAMPYSIMVDQQGARLCNEAASYMEVGERMYERHREMSGAIPSWTIFDSRQREQYAWATAVPGTTPSAWLQSGYMKKADTLEQLAAQCGIDPAGLSKTVERWNAFCEDGVDRDYGRGRRRYDRSHGDPTMRPNPNLGPISRPPYFAVAMFPCDVGTAGGLVTDEWARVLRGDGSPIEGLYATGNTTASVMGRTYPGAGASIAASLTFAYIAAHHCAGRSDIVETLIAGAA